MKRIVLGATGSARSSLTLIAILSFTLLCVSVGAQTASEKILYSFNPQATDGFSPYANLIGDTARNFYGTTNAGGTNSVGSVFELSPRRVGGWTETVLYSFNYNGSDRYQPQAGLVFDAEGNLFGATTNGGTYAARTVQHIDSPANSIGRRT